MLKHVKYLLWTYGLFVIFFVMQKPVFLLYHWKQVAPDGVSAIFKVMWHGLPMDLSVAGYFTLLPLLILLISVYFDGRLFGKFLQGYFIFVCFCIALLFIADLELYTYWGFRIDATIFTYITKPSEALASIPVWKVLLLLLFAGVWGFAQLFVLNKLVARPLMKTRRSLNRTIESILIVLLGGIMFIAIRGGIATSTMNMSKVYFSKNNFLNHAAVNPVFSFGFSLEELDDSFDTQYRFMSADEAAQHFRAMMPQETTADSTQKVLKTERPNVVIIILESFGAPFIECLGGAPDVTPNLCALANESIFFPHLYANSFRTDRGLTSVLSGYPAQPTTTVIKYPKKAQALQSIPKSLWEAGYTVSFLYGGDVDFAFIKSYLVAQKVTDITSDSDFALSDRMSKWGVPDAVTFDKLLSQIKTDKKEPFCKIFLTLSSHEPFDVPTKKFSDPFLNAVHYTDSCLGKFVHDLKQMPAWDNTLLVLIPDHGTAYPNLASYEPARHAAFMLWAGGAVNQPLVIDKICSQSDMAATLLAQLNIDYSAFTFSKNVFSSTEKIYAFYDFPNGFGLVAPEGEVVFDCNTNSVLLHTGAHADSLLLQGKAYLQSLYDDLERL